MSYDYLLDKQGDISISSTGDLVLATSKIVLAKQSIETGLKTLKGEWFLDTSEGVDWLGILSRRNNKIEVDLEIKRVIKNSSYVTRIVEYNTNFNRATNKYFVSFKALVETGEVLSVNDLEI